MSTSPQSEARGLERLIQLKHDIVLKCQITFNVGLNAAKNMRYTKKVSIKSSSELNFVTKKSTSACVYFLPEWS